MNKKVKEEQIKDSIKAKKKALKGNKIIKK